MCRFVVYLGRPLTLDMLTTRPKHSIVRQSYKAQKRREPLNGDGFGVGWYMPELSAEPAVFRSITPAWNNLNLQNLAKVTRSHCILAHVRAASPGLPVTQLNCHPFVAGRLAFMHNGCIPGFGQLRRSLIGRLSDEAFALIGGSTDSEHMLALCYDRVRREPESGVEGLAAGLLGTLRSVEELQQEHGITAPPKLNLAVTDGRCAVVSRYASRRPEQAESLYVHSGKEYICDADRCRMVEPDTGRGAVLVASEPLSADPGWEAVPPNHLVLVAEDLSVTVRPVEPPA